MIDQFKTKASRDGLLQPFNVLIDEFDHGARLHIDEMVVMRLCGLFVPRPSIPKVMSGYDARLLEQSDRSIDRRDRNVGVDFSSAAIELFHIRVVLRDRQDLRNDPSLFGHAHSLLEAKFLDAVHVLGLPFPVRQNIGLMTFGVKLQLQKLCVHRMLVALIISPPATNLLKADTAVEALSRLIVIGDFKEHARHARVRHPFQG